MEQLVNFAHSMADNGASVVSTADPTAIEKNLGPKMFSKITVLCLNKIIEAIRAMLDKLTWMAAYS